MGDVSLELRAVAYPEGERWVAHCLELDIVAEGSTAREAVDSLVDLCGLQIQVALDEHEGIAAILRPAPKEIWELYFKSSKKVGRSKAIAHVERFDARELVVV